MKDRVPLYPGRVTLLPVAGQPNTFDMVRADQPVEVGTPINKAALFSDAASALYGSGCSTVSEALFKIPFVMNVGWKLLHAYTVRGSYVWVAPDLFCGTDYFIGVLVIGGGGSGASRKTNGSSSYLPKLTGGASGYSQSIIRRVAPGESINVIIGAGGASVTDSFYGNDGMASSFGAITANGGEQGKGSYTDYYISKGASNGIVGKGTFGGVESDDPLSCFNPFTAERILGSGGGAEQRQGTGSLALVVYEGGKSQITGLGGGDGSDRNAGENASAPGCGGGTAATNSVKPYPSGAGADGAVYLYVFGAMQ